MIVASLRPTLSSLSSTDVVVDETVEHPAKVMFDTLTFKIRTCLLRSTLHMCVAILTNSDAKKHRWELVASLAQLVHLQFWLRHNYVLVS